MGQVSGKDARPKELGNTGIIVLNKCDMGKCDCVQVLSDAKDKKEQRKCHFLLVQITLYPSIL